jgi:release factor glutamine methyltransferase
LPDTAALTVREAVRRGTQVLRDAGSESPRLDTELLLAFALGIDRARLWMEDVSVPTGFDELLARRAAREPVAYITGVKPFRRLSLAVDWRVLIPRPETELLVEAGLGLARGARVADVGTGSGAVALALKDERPDLVVTGTDSSPDALSVARANASRLGLDVRFVEADLLGEARQDAVLANLPYVPAGAPDLAEEIVRYEPAQALFAGTDGLDVIRRLIARVDRVPFVALEVGLDQAPVVAELLGGAGFRSLETVRDLAGIERVVVGRR